MTVAMPIKIKRVDAWTVEAAGKPVLLVREGADWNGFTKLKAVDRAGWLVVMFGASPMREFFNNVFGDDGVEFSVIAGTPDLMHDLARPAA